MQIAIPDTNFRAYPYIYSSDTLMNVLNGSRTFAPPHGAPITIDTSESGFFYIADVIRDSYNTWTTFRPNDVLDETHVLLQSSHPDSAFTFYAPNRDIMVIERSSVQNTGFPDTWDRDIISHEFGHRLHFKMGFLDSILTTESPIHTTTSISSKEFAAREAFGHFWSCLSKNESLRIDHYNNFQDTTWQNLENGEYGYKGISGTDTIGTTNTR